MNSSENIIKLVKDNALYIPAQDASTRSALWCRPFSSKYRHKYDIVNELPKNYPETAPRTLSCYELTERMKKSDFINYLSPENSDVSHLVLTPKQILFVVRNRKSLGHDIVMQMADNREPKLHKFLILNNLGQVGNTSMFFIDSWGNVSKRTIVPWLFFGDDIHISPGLFYI